MPHAIVSFGRAGFVYRYLLLKFATEADAQRFVRENNQTAFLPLFPDQKLRLEMCY